MTVGNNAVPGEVNYGAPSAQYQAEDGYDMVSGLGSVNVKNLLDSWDSVTFSPTTTTLTISESTVTHGSSVPFSVVVAPANGTGSPTGNISLLASVNSYVNAFNDSLGIFPLSAGGAISSSASDLPGGVNRVEAYYQGDSTYASSYSVGMPVDVTPEPSTTTLSMLTTNSNGTAFVPFTGGAFGSFVYLRANVAGLSGHGTPTGSVNFTDSFGAIPGGTATGLSLALNSGDSLQSGAYTATPNGIFNFDTGTHSVSASYPGDNSFNASSSSPPVSFTITPGFYAAISTAQSTVSISAPGGSGSTSVSVSSSTGFSGTISLACAGLPAGAVCTFTPATITASGKLTTTSSTINVTTTAATTSALPSPGRPGFDRWLAFSGLLVFSFVLASVPGRRRFPVLLTTLFGLMILLPSCGGGGSKTTTPPPPVVTPTPAGSYSVTVNATSSSTTYQTEFTLVVQ